GCPCGRSCARSTMTARPRSPVLPGDSPMRAVLFVLAAGLASPALVSRAADPPKEWTFTGQTEGTDPLIVTFEVSEIAFLQLRRAGVTALEKVGVALGLAGEKGYPHFAKLLPLGAAVDPNTAAVRFRATMPNPKGLLMPGMSARIRLTLPAKSGRRSDLPA